MPQKRCSPKSLDPYLHHMVDQLLNLWDGVPAVDGSDGTDFKLRAMLVGTVTDYDGNFWYVYVYVKCMCICIV